MTLSCDSFRVPPPLKKGDKVGIVSTARKISAKELQFALDTIANWGLIPELGEHIFSVENQFAGNDQIRTNDFQKMMDNPDIKAIICARGGYGTVRMVDGLNFESFIKRPKWVAGFSDVTVLHSHLHNLKVCSLHSTMPISFSDNSHEAINSLKTALFGKTNDLTFDKHPLNINGRCQGQIVGGNLSVLYSLIGSSSEINTKNKILFLEDLDEYLYHIDRMMVNLKRSGKLKHLSGLVIGGMTQMNDNAIPYGKDVKSIIRDTVYDYNIPLCFDFPAGHIKHNLAIQLGRHVSLNVDETVELRYV